MAFTTKLFRIVVSNSYYKSSSVQNDFHIEPMQSTASWMVERRVRMLHHPDGIELIWLSQNYDDPLRLFKTKADGVTLSFTMILKNSQALNLSQLDVGYPNGQLYYLSNRSTSNNNLLHTRPFMGESDLAKIQDIPHYPTGPGANIFAMIDIDLIRCLHALAKQKNSLFGQPVTYKIKIQSRATFWRYYLVDTKKRLNRPLAILSQGDTSYFSEVQPSAKFPNAYCAESTMPIELFDQYDRSFSLCKLDKAGLKSEDVVLEKLPYPTYDSLKRDGAGNKKKLYSDIVVYV